MAEASQYIFSHKEVAEALVRKQGIHEGIWGLYLEFGIQGANINIAPSEEMIVPAAVVPVLKLGVQKFEKMNNLTVDAAVVNPMKEGQ
ncbi:MAG: hypothetical protein ACREDR_01965 [Blastocatellia bacterium]